MLCGFSLDALLLSDVERVVERGEDEAHGDLLTTALPLGARSRVAPGIVIAAGNEPESE